MQFPSNLSDLRNSISVRKGVEFCEASRFGGLVDGGARIDIKVSKTDILPSGSHVLVPFRINQPFKVFFFFALASS